MESIIVACITGLVTLVGVILFNSKSRAVCAASETEGHILACRWPERASVARRTPLPSATQQRGLACLSGGMCPFVTPTQLSQGKFPLLNALSYRALPCRRVRARGVSLLGSILPKRFQGCTHLYSPLSTLFVVTLRGVVTRTSGSNQNRR